MFEVAHKAPALAGKRLYREDGQALVEYSLILGLVCVVAIALLSAMGASVTSLLQIVTSALDTAL